MIGNNKTTNFKIVVRVKTKYGTTTDCSGATITLWDYAPPTVKVNKIERASANVTLTGTITINTTIPSITTTSTHWRWVGGSNTNFSVTNSSNEKIKNFTLTISASQDRTGTIHVASSDTVRDLLAKVVTMPWGNTEVSVKGYMPVMSLTKEGVGINTRPLSGYKFSVEGNTKINGNLATNGLTLSSLTVSGTTNLNGTTNLKATVVNGDIRLKSPNNTWTGDFIKRYEGDANGMGVAIQTGGKIVLGSGESAIAFMDKTGSPAGETLHLTSDQNVELISNMQNGYDERKSLVFGNSGRLHFPQGGYITLPDNRGTWLNGATNASLRSPAQQTTGSYHSLMAQTTSSGHKISLGGLGDDFGFHVYDAARTENGLDKYFRVNLANKTVNTDMRFVVYSEWLYTTGNTGWYNSTHGGGWYMQDSTWMRSYNNKSIYTGGEVKCNIVTTRSMNAIDGQNIDINTKGRALGLNCSSASGVWVEFKAQWSGTKGTEPSLFNTSGNGWGYIGGSGYSWYRVYGSGGSVSDRNKKYDIVKADCEEQYENIKNINLYNYRTISDTVNEETGEIEEKIYRQDLMLGAMVDELPTEVVFYDNESGDGKAVDTYSYTSMILGATKHLQTKVENLEKENDLKDRKIDELESRLEKMEELLNGFINRE